MYTVMLVYVQSVSGDVVVDHVYELDGDMINGARYEYLLCVCICTVCVCVQMYEDIANLLASNLI